MKKVLVTFGTRPEAIKMAPLCRELKSRSERIHMVCCVTGQHRELLQAVLDVFHIRPDHDLKVQKDDQDLFHITSSVLERFRDVLLLEKPDLVAVQGDTTSAFAAALGAFYLKVPVAHVEAGLRSHDRFQPYPEEFNRTAISHLADLNFCPTQRAAQNLLNEQIPPHSIHVLGNTVIDALLRTVEVLNLGHEASRYPDELGLPPGPMILVTGHRRENFGPGLRNLSLSLLDLAEANQDISVVYSVHPNPNVRAAVESILGRHERIRIVPPPDYFRFVALMQKAYLIITDSGGIQEEAPSLKKPVLVARNVTERPEAIEAGTALLVGTDRARIVREASRLLHDPKHYESMIAADNPFGDGRSAVKIADIIERFLDSQLGLSKK